MNHQPTIKTPDNTWEADNMYNLSSKRNQLWGNSHVLAVPSVWMIFPTD